MQVSFATSPPLLPSRPTAKLTALETNSMHSSLDMSGVQVLSHHLTDVETGHDAVREAWWRA